MDVLKTIWNFRSSLLLVLLPIVLLPLPIVLKSSAASCGYCIILISGLWISEVLPLAVTSFLPLVLFPLMGIMTASDVSVAYMKDTNWFIVGGLMIAVGIQHTRLHERIALRVLLSLGSKPHSLMFGFMLTTYLLSMWMSNTATTAMMMPIVTGVLEELRKEHLKKIAKEVAGDETESDDATETESNIQETGSSKYQQPIEQEHNSYANASFDLKEDVSIHGIEPEWASTTSEEVAGDEEELNDAIETEINTQETGFSKYQQSNEQQHNSDANASSVLKEEFSIHVVEPEKTSIASENNAEDAAIIDKMEKSTSTEKGLTLCVPYAASIGGIATLTGSAPNALLAGQYSLLFPDAEPEITFGNWIAYHLPISFVLFLFAYLWMMWLFLGFNLKTIKDLFKRRGEIEKNIRNHLLNEYNQLGTIRWAEVTVLIVLIVTVLLWLFRDPGIIPGWSGIFKEGYVSDGTVSMTMAVLLFILPSERPAIICKDNCRSLKPVQPVLNWATTHRMFPWHIIFVLGGGFALAEGATVSGFSAWVGNQLAGLGNAPDWIIALVLSTIVCIFTQCVSNLAATSIFIPIVAELAQGTSIHPLYLLLPMVTASNLAYMLPVATPANAIAFANGDVVEVIDLVKAGWLLCVFGLALLVFFINTFGDAIYGVNNFPEWASSNYTTDDFIVA